MERTNFVNLRVYQLAEGLADDIWDVVTRWNVFARDTVGKQMVRSADSISANIAEGSGRGSVVENRRFVRISRGSMYETRNWLRRAFRRKLITSKQVESLSKGLDELTLTLNGYLRSLTDKPEI
jgi:four helix bundle protein